MNRLLVTFLFSCFLTLTFAQDDMKETRKYIEEQNRKIESAMLDGNVEAMSDYYADDIISLPSYEPMIKGKNKIIQKTKEEMKSGFKFNSVKFKTLEVFGSGNHVYEIGEYDVTMVMPEMPQPVNDQGKYITVWEKGREGQWKAVAEMWNTNHNPWMNSNEKQETDR
jgi:ketosteroid isomerase-like protein